MQKKLRITVAGKTYDVVVEVVDEGGGSTAPVSAPMPSPVSVPQANLAPASAPKPAASPAPQASGGNVIPAPLAGIVLSVDVAVGQSVQAEQQILVLEAMKMQTPLFAPRAGVVKEIFVKTGDTVTEGAPLLSLE